MQAFSVVAVVFLSAGAAARFTSSRATATVAPASPALDGMTPKPTLGHMFMDHEMLFRRQDTDDVIYVAPDETCGYLQGSSQYPLTCGVSSTCSAIPALNGMACCGDEFCRARFRCLDYSKAFNTRSCDSSCWDDPMTLKCSESANPYCITFSYNGGGYSDYICFSSSSPSVVGVSFSYSGQSRSWATTNWDASETFDPNFKVESENASNDPVVITSVIVSIISPSPTEPAPIDDDESSSREPAPIDDESSSNIGAIVGGVIGGIAVLALIGFGFFWFFKKRKGNSVSAVGAASEQPTTAPGGGASMTEPGTQRPQTVMVQNPVGPGYQHQSWGGPSPVASPPPMAPSPDASAGFTTGIPGSGGAYSAPMASPLQSPAQPGYHPQEPVYGKPPAYEIPVGKQDKRMTHELA